MFEFYNPYQVASFVFAIIQLLGIILVMSQCAWQVIIIFIHVAGMCVWLQQYYLPSAREMSRLVGVYKGPVIQNFAEPISGSTTIQSFDQQARFLDTSLKLNDDFSRPKFNAAAMEWLGIQLDMLSSFTFVVFLIFLVSIPEGTIDASSVCTTYATCVARPCVHFHWRKENWDCRKNWEVNSNTHTLPSCGACNWTDSDRWDQYIDNRIHDIRSRLSIIPKDPTMFEGTIRSNLDPLEEYTYEKNWEALDKYQLGEEVRSKEGKLDSPGLVHSLSINCFSYIYQMWQFQHIFL
ncbi:putative ABC-type xenobiotic transporter [Helianthus debilis subsp. tardiflorus]